MEDNASMGDPYFPEINPTALKIMNKRNYTWPKEDGSRETPNEMFIRVSNYVASAEKEFGPEHNIPIYASKFYEMMRSLRFMPNTPTLINAGRDRGQLAACYVLPCHDSMESIMDALKSQAIVQKSGGGTGFSFGEIRERHSKIKSTGMDAVGPIPIIKLMNNMMSEFIIQGGVRHGANMGVLPIDHPDLYEFITFKKKDGSCKSFNISVAVTDAFMEAVVNDSIWHFKSRVDGSIVASHSARLIFDAIATSAHETGDPGILFIDEANRFNPTPQLGRLEATNPCGEQWLLPNEACTLGHLNLSQYYINGSSWETSFNWDQFTKDISLGVRFLDDVIQVNYYALPEIEKMHKIMNRKIGLGVMGLADFLIKCGVSYASELARTISRKIASVFRGVADIASRDLGLERGSFGAFEGSAVQAEGWVAMRNACRTTVAPTGTSAIFADASPSIEPDFAFLLKRLQAEMEICEFHPLFEKYIESLPEDTTSRIISWYEVNGTLQNCPDIDEQTQSIFIQANDVSIHDHVMMQAVWQEYIDNSISKTINMASSATVQDVKDAYMLAWQTKCKGITVYRDQSREGQALNANVAAFTTKKQNDWIVVPSTMNFNVFMSEDGKDALSYTSIKTDVPSSAYNTVPTCPECQNLLDVTAGCKSCSNCGFSLCSIA